MHEEKWRQNRKRNKEKEREKNSQEPQQKNVQLMILPTTTTTTTIPHLLLLLLLPPPSFAMRLAPPFGTALLSFPPEKKLRALMRISSPSSNLATKVLYLIVSERERLKAHNLAKKVLVFFSVYKREKLEAHKDGKLEAFVE
jgi:hypothetical protein